MTNVQFFLSDANTNWLQSQADPDEIVNGLIQRARAQDAENDWIREQLRKAAASGTSTKTAEEVRIEAKRRLGLL